MELSGDYQQPNMPDTRRKEIGDDIRHPNQGIRFVDKADRPFPVEGPTWRRPSLNFLISLRGSRRLPGHSEEIFGVDSKEMLQCRSIFGAQLDCAKFTGHE